MARRAPRSVPLRFDDAFRGGITMGGAVVVVLALFALDALGLSGMGRTTIIVVTCAAVTAAFAGYLVWTHRVFQRAARGEVMRVAALQHRQRVSPLARMLGSASTESWAISAAAVALMGAIAAAVFGATDGGVVITVSALLTAGAAWATVAYAFGLRYLRLHAAGERFEFGIEDEPEFGDFISLALMVSSVGALSAASPRTRPGLQAVRTHTVIAFVFNAIVVAMTVSLLAGLIASLAG